MDKSPIFYDIFKSPIGLLYLVFSGKYLSRVSFKKPPYIAFKKGAASKEFIKELTSYFQGSSSNFSQRIKFLIGTDFEKRVWFLLKEIPAGETKTYKWLAERSGSPSSTRAVGRALSKNPTPIILPCHRVIESNGSIGGYSLGVNIKIRLLEMEYYLKMNNKNTPSSHLNIPSLLKGHG